MESGVQVSPLEKSSDPKAYAFHKFPLVICQDCNAAPSDSWKVIQTSQADPQTPSNSFSLIPQTVPVPACKEHNSLECRQLLDGFESIFCRAQWHHHISLDTCIVRPVIPERLHSVVQFPKRPE